jgi:hypothetical protein
MTLIYTALAVAIVTAVMQANLDKAGIGRVEATEPSMSSTILVLLSIPFTLLSNLGVVVVIAWSFFVLPWLSTLGVIAVAYVFFSLLWGYFIATIRRSTRWSYLVAIGIPLVFALRILCAICVMFLVVSYVRGATL